MSRGRTKQLPPDLCGHVTSAFTGDGLAASVTVGAYSASNLDGIVGAGDLLILSHVVDSTNPGVGQPNTIGNPWTAGLKPDGTVVDETVTGPTGSLRMRVWWKQVTQAEVTAVKNGSTQTYTVTDSFTARPGLSLRIIPWSAIGPGTLPLQFTVAKGPGGKAWAPAITLPDHTGLFRDVGLLGCIGAWCHDADRSVYYDGRTPVAPFNPAGWTVREGAYAGSVPTGTTATKMTRIDSGLSLEPLHGQASQRYNARTGGSNEARANVPWIAATYLIRPYRYPAPTPGAAWSSIHDDFTDPATLADWDTAGTPTITGGRLVLAPGDSVLRKARADFTRHAVVIDVADYNPGAVGNRLQLIVTDADITGGGRCAVAITTGLLDNDPAAPVLRVTWIDDGFGEDYAYVRVAPDTRWWRIREEDGYFCLDHSTDRVAWRTGTFVAHTLLPDQLATMRVGLSCAGAATAAVDNLNPAPLTSPPALPDRVPFDSTYEFMGAGPALREQWHGRDPIVGVVDQGSTAAVRAKQNTTLLARAYFLGKPPDGAEVFHGGVHGCLVTTSAVPTGGRTVEAVVFDGGEYTTIDVVMRGILYCALAGAKVINVSIGGGGDDPVIPAVFGYIAANLDCEIYCSSGNDSGYGIAIPAAYSTVFENVHSVGAWNEFTNLMASFSNHHELVSGMAPGQHGGGRLPNGALVTWSGTSLAAPLATNLNARGQTVRPGGQRWLASQVGVAMDRNPRQTTRPRSEQGRGLYDLALALAVIGDPTGRTNVPEVGMPRFTHDQKVGVAAGFDQMARAVELAGSLCLVHYRPVDETSGLPTWAGLPSGQRLIIGWTEATVDSYAGMWAPGSSVLQAPDDGMYLAVAHIRFGTQLVNGSVATGGAYVTGSRGTSILLNGTDPVANLVAVDEQPATDWDGGTTAVVAAILPMLRDEWVYADVYQTSGSTIQAGQDDFGGTWFALARLSPLAPAA